MSRNARSRMGRAIKAAPSFSLDFTRGVLDPRLTFTRASGATFIGSDGLLQTAASNAPRFDYDPITLACKGLLIEEARTNILLQSVDITNAAWTPLAGGAVKTTGLAAPDGTTNAVRLNFAASADGLSQSVTATITAGNSYTASIYTRNATGNVRLRIARGGGGTFESAEVATNTTGVWTRVSIPLTFANAQTAVRLDVINQVAGAASVEVFAPQLELGAFPTSYIPTTGAAATRAAEQCNSALGPWFNPSEGCVAVDMLMGPDGVESRFLAFDDGSSTNRLVFQRINTNLLSGFGTGFASGWGLNTTGIGARSGQGTRHVVCGSYGTRTTSRLSSDGVLGNASAQVIASPGAMLTRMTVGHNIGATQHNGHIRAIDYYPVALEPQTLRRLTSATESPARRINPDFSLHFLDGVLDSRITFTRASSGTRINSAGVLVTETTNAPRFDYDPITLACKGLLIEEARTNLETSSRVTATGNGLASVTQNAAGADAATNTAWTIGEDTASTTHTTSTAGTVAYVLGTTYSLTRLVKPGTATKCQITGTVAIFGTTFYANFSLVGAGSVLASGAGTTATIKPGPNGFYACTITGAATATAAGVGNAVAFINTDTDTRLPSFTGASRTLIVDHAQAEAGAFPTSIIPTTGAAATRAGDAVLVTGSNFSSVYNATQGTLAAEFIRTNGDSGSGSPGLFQADDGSSNNRTALRLNSRLANAAAQGTVVVGGSVITNTGSTSSALQGGVVRATMSYAMAGGNASVAGGTAGAYTLTALPTACTQFAIGGGGGSLGATALNGHMRHIDYYKQALPADFITELSR